MSVKKPYFFRYELWVHLAFWVFFASMVNVLWWENWLLSNRHLKHVAPISALLTPVFFYLNALWLIPSYLKRRQWWRYFLITASFLLITEGLRSLLFGIYLQHEEGLWLGIQQSWWSRDNLIFGFPNSLFFAFALSFAYRFSKDWIVNQQLIQRLQREKTEAKLQSLKAQVNPHFLFNNLNALDDLIDRDSRQAKTYLQKLASLYRHLANDLEIDVVPLEKEWAFIQDYIYLLEVRYGAAYQFELSNTETSLSSFLIPTAALQVLLENVVKHNHGDPASPLLVSLRLDAKGISVENEKRPKAIFSERKGTGLQNLKSRYQLLSKQPIIVTDNEDTFKVYLPHIIQSKAS